jgi:hypothetical protein
MSKVTSKFQVGDRVEFLENYGGRAETGDLGTVVDVERPESGPAIITVAVDNGMSASCFEYRLKLVEEEAVPVVKEFRFFRRGDSSISMQPYETFEAALAGWKPFAQDGNEVEIIEFVSHGKYKAVLKIEEAL